MARSDHSPCKAELLSDSTYELFENSIDVKNSSLFEWLNHKQAAAYLKVSEGELRNKASNGKIPYYKLGRRNLYRLVELRDLILSEKRGGHVGNKV